MRFAGRHSAPQPAALITVTRRNACERRHQRFIAVIKETRKHRVVREA
jgi:hypothetical protein